jgi:hypothetical protein
MIRALLVVFGMLAPLPALALSCMEPSVERSYAQADASEDFYVVVHGRVSLDTKLLPHSRGGETQPPEMTLIQGVLVGKSLSKRGFKLPFDHNITLEVACFGPWCGSIQNGEDVLAFVRKDGEAYVLGVNPCGGDIFSAPKRKALKTVQKCLRSGGCPSY